MHKDFAERLKKLEEGPQKASTASQAPHFTAGKLSKKDKVALSLQIMESKGISANNAYPPLMRGLAKMGLHCRPFMYQSLFGWMVFGMFFMFAVFGGIYASGIGALFSRGPVAGLHSGGWLGVILITLIGGGVFGIFMKIHNKKYGLPNWRDIGE
jgi:hypothetical protein